MIEMSSKDKSYALFGLLLGDGHWMGKGKVIQIEHTEPQKFYVDWLENICKKWKLDYTRSITTRHLSSSSIIVKRDPSRLGYEYLSYVIRIHPPLLKHFSEERWFRTDGDKKIKYPSKYVLRRINPMGLLFWYLDDGWLKVRTFENNKGYEGCERRMGLCTQGYTHEENLRIAEMMQNRFSVKWKVVHPQQKHLWTLVANATNVRRFFDVLRPLLPYVPSEFSYKFDLEYRQVENKWNHKYVKDYSINALLQQQPPSVLEG